MLSLGENVHILISNAKKLIELEMGMQRHLHVHLTPTYVRTFAEFPSIKSNSHYVCLLFDTPGMRIGRNRTHTTDTVHDTGQEYVCTYSTPHMHAHCKCERVYQGSSVQGSVAEHI